MTLILGKHTFKNPVIQGPLAGYTDYAFRHITHTYGAPSYCVSEMIPANLLAHMKPHQIVRHQKNKNAAVYAIQLAHHTPEVFQDASLIAQKDLHADIIDINCGCPVKKIRKKGHGTKLLESPERIAQCIDAIKQKTSLPVTLKIRLHTDMPIAHIDYLCEHLHRTDLDALIVHPRSWRQSYETPINLNALKYITKHSTIPVIANGDINSPNELQTYRNYGCQGIMIAKAGFGRPALYTQTKKQKEWIGQNIGAILKEHIAQTASFLLPSRQYLHALGIVKYYAKAHSKPRPPFETWNHIDQIHTWIDLSF